MSKKLAIQKAQQRIDEIKSLEEYGVFDPQTQIEKEALKASLIELKNITE